MTNLFNQGILIFIIGLIGFFMHSKIQRHTFHKKNLVKHIPNFPNEEYRIRGLIIKIMALEVMVLGATISIISEGIKLDLIDSIINAIIFIILGGTEAAVGLSLIIRMVKLL